MADPMSPERLAARRERVKAEHVEHRYGYGTECSCGESLPCVVLADELAWLDAADRLRAELDRQRRTHDSYVRAMRASFDAEIVRLNDNIGRLVEELGKAQAERDYRAAQVEAALGLAHEASIDYGAHIQEGGTLSDAGPVVDANELSSALGAGDGRRRAVADAMTRERRARLLADVERLAALVEAQGLGVLTIPNGRDMEALARILRDVPALDSEADAYRGANTRMQELIVRRAQERDEARTQAKRHFDALCQAFPRHFTPNVLGERLCGCDGQWPCREHVRLAERAQEAEAERDAARRDLAEERARHGELVAEMQRTRQAADHARAELARAEGELDEIRGLGEPAAGQLRALVEEAFHLRQHGERAPGGTETWAAWERRAEAVLRGLVEAELS